MIVGIECHMQSLEGQGVECQVLKYFTLSAYCRSKLCIAFQMRMGLGIDGLHDLTGIQDDLCCVDMLVL